MERLQSGADDIDEADAKNEELNEQRAGRARTGPDDDVTTLGITTIPVSGAQSLIATGGFGIAQGTTGSPLSGAALYPAVVPDDLEERPTGGRSIADAAEVALAEDGRLSQAALSRIELTAEDGVVRLSGTVPSESEREVAVQIVRRLPGVAQVENRLAVSSG